MRSLKNREGFLLSDALLGLALFSLLLGAFSSLVSRQRQLLNRTDRDMAQSEKLFQEWRRQPPGLSKTNGAK